MTRGLFRLWVVLSATWILYRTWTTSELSCTYNALFNREYGPWCLNWSHGNPDGFNMDLTTNLIGPPLIAGFLLLSFFWITAGFQKDTQK